MTGSFNVDTFLANLSEDLDLDLLQGPDQETQSAQDVTTATNAEAGNGNGGIDQAGTNIRFGDTGSAEGVGVGGAGGAGA